MTPADTVRSGDPPQPPLRLVVVASGWALLYAAYRTYYAFGGTRGLIGIPISESRLQAINTVGAAIVVVAAVLPWLVLGSGRFRRVTPVLGWLVAVGCCMHALVDGILRVLSLSGVHPTRLPSSVWASYDRRSADLQDLFLNEPWFLVQGLLWTALTWSVVRRARRRAWLASAILATAALTLVGVLSGLGVLGSFTVL